jgi:hypothetical protein
VDFLFCLLVSRLSEIKSLFVVLIVGHPNIICIVKPPRPIPDKISVSLIRNADGRLLVEIALGRRTYRGLIKYLRYMGILMALQK